MDYVFDKLQELPNLRKLKIYLNSYDLNCNFQNLPIKSLSIKSKFRIVENDPIFYHLIQLNSITRISMTDGFISMKSLKRMEKYELEKFKLINTQLESRLCLQLVNMIKNNKQLKNLTVISKDYSTNPHAIIIMSEIISRLKRTDEWNVEILKFTLDQSCKIKYKNLMLLTKIRKMCVYYNVQNDIRNLDTLIDAILSMRNIHVTFKEYMTPFQSCSGDVDYLMRNFKCLSKCYANNLKMLGTKVTVLPLKY